MSYAIVTSSKGGNTRMVADALRRALEGAGATVAYDGSVPDPQDASAQAAIAGADAVLAGFWTDKGDCAPDMAAFLEGLEAPRVFLFGTAGFGGSDAYFARILGNVRAHVPQGVEVAGGAMCQGKMAPAVRERYVVLQAEHPDDPKYTGMIANFDAALAHPDAQDLARIAQEALSALGLV